MDIKAQLDKYSPIGNDKLAILEVEKQLKSFIDIFVDNFKKSIDGEIHELIHSMHLLIESWRNKMLDNLNNIPVEVRKKELKSNFDQFDIVK